TRRPTFLHLRTTRIMGHAGTDFEIEWRSIQELMAVEATDPLLRSAAIALESGLMTPDELLERYEAMRKRCFAAAEEADRRPRLETLEEVMAPLAPYTPDKVAEQARRKDFQERRLEVFGGEAKLPENQPPRHLAIPINDALHDQPLWSPATLSSGAVGPQNAGVSTVTRGLRRPFRGARVFNALLGETMILGLDQGYGNLG